jgi:hypothetical protein
MKRIEDRIVLKLPLCSLSALFILCGTLMQAAPQLPVAPQLADKPYREWTLETALGVLTNSPWAKQETYTQVVGGVGSGIAGAKEIYSTFFVRLLSARPIREAFARIRQIESNYDGLSRDEKRKLDSSLEPGLRTDFHRWIVFTLWFRSNDPSVELRVKQFLEVQTTDTMKNRAYLSTTHFPQLELAAYFPPREDVVGAKFVFPRRVVGIPVVFSEDDMLTFELDIPGFDPALRVRFDVASMLQKGEPVL